MPQVKKTIYRKRNKTLKNQKLQIKLSQLLLETNLLNNTERERERANSPMPENNELDSPTTVVGGDEYFPTRGKELLEEIRQLKAELQSAQHNIKLLEIQAEHNDRTDTDYRT
jgi:hypothetical protein